MNYQDFIEQKRIKVQASGFDVEAGQLNEWERIINERGPDKPGRVEQRRLV